MLSEEECMGLLASCEIGRVGVVAGGRPLIFPVNFVLEGRYVLVHTDVGAKLDGASFAHVAFEVDDFDATTRSGWSVLVQGMAHDVTDAIDHTSEHLQTIGGEPWAPGPKPRLLRIEAATVTGRRFQGPRAVG
ncbi:MAG: pyridoxamine 5'-phosphate oxidase family protein [Acidimicrobiales bacterium]